MGTARLSKPSKGFVLAEEVRLRSNPGERWVRVLRSPHLPDAVVDLMFAFESDGNDAECIGLALRTDGGPTGALMRDLQLAALESDARSAAGLLLSQKPRVTVDPGAGRAGVGDEFLEQIHELHRYAVARHPRRPIAWMHAEGLPQRLRNVDVETVRTWVRKARRSIG